MAEGKAAKLRLPDGSSSRPDRNEPVGRVLVDERVFWLEDDRDGTDLSMSALFREQAGFGREVSVVADEFTQGPKRNGAIGVPGIRKGLLQWGPSFLGRKEAMAPDRRTLYLGPPGPVVNELRGEGVLTAAFTGGILRCEDIARFPPDVHFSDWGSLQRWLNGGEFFSPHRCGGCPRLMVEGEDGAWAAQCVQRCFSFPNTYLNHRPCPRCGQPDLSDMYDRCWSCNQLAQNGLLKVKRATVAYLFNVAESARDPFTRAVQRFKGRDGEPADIDLALPLGSLFLPLSMIQVLRCGYAAAPFSPPDAVIVPVPSSPSSLVNRGFCPVRALLTAFLAPLLLQTLDPDRFRDGDGRVSAREVLGLFWDEVLAALGEARPSAKGRRWEIGDVLRKEGGSTQHLTYRERLAAAPRSYRLTPGAAGAVADRDVILFDDVITTGASINTCAGLLLDAGARSVSAVALARNASHRFGRCSACDGWLKVQVDRGAGTRSIRCGRCGWTSEALPDDGIDWR